MRSWLLQSISLAIQQRRKQLRLSLLVYVSLTLVVQVLRDSVIEVVLSGYTVKANSHSNNYLHLAKNSSKYISFSAWKTISTGVQLLSPTSLQVNWGEPSQCNGEILGYCVEYHTIDETSGIEPVVVPLPGPDHRSLLVENLIENMEYRWVLIVYLYLVYY